MSLLGGHLGARTSALLDGQLPAEEAERSWLHVRDCAACSQLIEREAWLKRRLAGLGQDPAVETPSALKGELMGAALLRPRTPLPAAADSASRSRTLLGIAALGSGALGAAFMGVLTLGASPADAPATQGPAPVSASSGVAPVSSVSRVNSSLTAVTSLRVPHP